MIRCIFFDRDGTLGDLTNERYPQTFTPYADIQKTVRLLHQKGYLVGILTNQASIARGTGKGYDFDAEFNSYGVDIWEICPHDTKENCDCRKPKPGLLLKACRRLNISPTTCILVGDRLSDIECAQTAKSKGILVLTGKGKKEKSEVLKKFPNTLILNRFDDIIEKIESIFE